MSNIPPEKIKELRILEGIGKSLHELVNIHKAMNATATHTAKTLDRLTKLLDKEDENGETGPVRDLQPG